MVHHRGTEGTEVVEEPQRHLTGAIVGAAIEVHRVLGPGLLESVYEYALCRELWLRGLEVERQIMVPVAYKGARLDTGIRLDLLVARTVIVEIKSVERIAAIHQAQLLTYLKLTNLRIGLLFNFNVRVLRNGIRRVVNG